MSRLFCYKHSLRIPRAVDQLVLFTVHYELRNVLGIVSEYLRSRGAIFEMCFMNVCVELWFETTISISCFEIFGTEVGIKFLRNTNTN